MKLHASIYPWSRPARPAPGTVIQGSTVNAKAGWYIFWRDSADNACFRYFTSQEHANAFAAALDLAGHKWNVRPVQAAA